MPTPKFQEGSDVLVEQRNIWYPSRVLSIEIRSGIPHYFVHFMKWNPKYDMWVEESLVESNTAENAARLKATFGLNAKKLQADLIAKSNAEKAANAVKSLESKTFSTKSSNQRERVRTSKVKRATIVANDPTVDSTDSNENEDLHEFPGSLKRRLVHDWEQITRRSLLIPLPCQPSVEKIFTSYLNARCLALNPAKAALTKQVCVGLENWFNEALHMSLLYNFERPQYFDIMRRSSQLKHSQVYGAEHFIRMLSRLPQLLNATAPLRNEERDAIERIGRDLCKYIVEAGDDIFTKTYQITDKEYFSLVAECNARIAQAEAAAKLKNEETTTNTVAIHST